MSEIFVSYASEDRARVAPLVRALESEGLQLWWDRDIDFGQSFHTAIEQALAAAPCVIVVWTQDALQSQWVINEASEARQRGCLIPVLLDAVVPPLEFRHLQGADLSDWKGDPADQAFAGLRKAVVAMLGRSEAPRSPSFDALPSRQWWQTWPGRMLGAGGLLVGISVLLLTLKQMGVVGAREQERNSVANTPAPSSPVAAPPEATSAASATERVNLLNTDAGARLITTNPYGEDSWKVLFTPVSAIATLSANDYAVLVLPVEKDVTFDTFAVFVDQLRAGVSVREIALYVSAASPDGPFVKAAQITVPNYRNLQNPFHEVRFAPVHARFLKIQVLSFHTTGGFGYIGSLRLY